MAEYVGRTVKKSFPGHSNLFEGRVTKVKYDRKKTPKYFFIEYEDGDSEDIELAELNKILLPIKSKGGGGSSRAAATQRTITPRKKVKRPAKKKRRSARKTANTQQEDVPAVAEALVVEAEHAGDTVVESPPIDPVAEAGPSRALADAEVKRELLSTGGHGGPNIFHHQVVFGDVAYISGQTAVDTSSASGNTLRGQIAQVLDQLDHHLRAAGSSRLSILKANVLLKSIPDGRDIFNEMWIAWIDSHRLPARTMWQADLASPELLVEVDAVAAITRP